jgi:hypothetical protein
MPCALNVVNALASAGGVMSMKKQVTKRALRAQGPSQLHTLRRVRRNRQFSLEGEGVVDDAHPGRAV